MEHKGNRKAQHEKSKEEYCASFLPRQQVVPREGGKTAERGGGGDGNCGEGGTEARRGRKVSLWGGVGGGDGREVIGNVPRLEMVGPGM